MTSKEVFLRLWDNLSDTAVDPELFFLIFFSS